MGLFKPGVTVASGQEVLFFRFGYLVRACPCKVSRSIFIRLKNKNKIAGHNIQKLKCISVINSLCFLLFSKGTFQKRKVQLPLAKKMIPLFGVQS